MRYLNGFGAEKSAAKAFARFYRSCTLGHANGCALLGALHAKGDGTSVNVNEAFRLSKLACEGGYGQCQRKCRSTRRFCCQQSSLLALQTGRSSPLLRTWSRELGMPTATSAFTTSRA